MSYVTAIVRGKPGFGAKTLQEAIEPYLPRHWYARTINEDTVEICGEEDAGWTFDDYVQPRLASGLYFAERVN